MGKECKNIIIKMSVAARFVSLYVFRILIKITITHHNCNDDDIIITASRIDTLHIRSRDVMQSYKPYMFHE